MRKAHALLAAAVLAASAVVALAQQIPGAPPDTISLRWTDGGVDVSQYLDAGFLYQPPSGGSIGTGPLGSYYLLTDGGTLAFSTYPIAPGSLGRIGIVVASGGGSTGTLQAQGSNDGASWVDLGTLLTLDGGLGPYSFGEPGSQSQISPCPFALVRILDSSTSTANSTLAATAFRR